MARSLNLPPLEEQAVAGNLPAGEAERVLRRIEQNFTALTRTVPMAEIEDLPPSMQTSCCGGTSDMGPIV
jgi:hypothetical protein